MRSYSTRNQRERRANIDQIAQERSGGINGSVRSVLTNLFFKMVVSMGVHKGDRWSQLMIGYTRDPRNSVAQNKPAETSARGNLNKALTAKTMSWRTFCTAMRFLNLRKFKIIIEAHHPNGSISHHETMVVLDDMIIEADDGQSDRDDE